MRLLLDEMHASVVAADLRARGLDVVAVTERAELRGTDDESLLALATAEGRAVVTENVRDFAPIAARWAAEGRVHAGVIFTSPTQFHRGSTSYPGNLARALAELAATGWTAEPSQTWWL